MLDFIVIFMNGLVNFDYEIIMMYYSGKIIGFMLMFKHFFNF